VLHQFQTRWPCIGYKTHVTVAESSARQVDLTQQMAFPSDSSHLARESENRFARITTNDHSAALWIATILSLIYAVLVLAVRLGFTKWRAHTLDDIVVTIAHVCNTKLMNCSCVDLTRSNGHAACCIYHVGIAVHSAR
jgi:anti-sigma-K factor RskA